MGRLQVDVAIVGAGLSGLACAVALHRVRPDAKIKVCNWANKQLLSTAAALNAFHMVGYQYTRGVHRAWANLFRQHRQVLRGQAGGGGGVVQCSALCCVASSSAACIGTDAIDIDMFATQQRQSWSGCFSIQQVSSNTAFLQYSSTPPWMQLADCICTATCSPSCTVLPPPCQVYERRKAPEGYPAAPDNAEPTDSSSKKGDKKQETNNGSTSQDAADDDEGPSSRLGGGVRVEMNGLKAIAAINRSLAAEVVAEGLYANKVLLHDTLGELMPVAAH